MNYNSIENLPIWNYNKILESGDFKKYGVKSAEDWENIEREYFTQIGHSEKYFEILRIRTFIALNKVKYYTTGDSFLKTLIEVEKEKLKDVIGTEKGGDFYFMTSQLSKFMGFNIDVKVTTVKEYYNHLKLAQNG